MVPPKKGPLARQDGEPTPPAEVASEDARKGMDLMRVVQHLPDVVFRSVRGPDGEVYFTMNEGRLAKEFHLTTEEVAGRPLSEIFPRERFPGIHENFEAAFDGDAREFVNEMGGRFFKHHPQPVYGPDGRVESVIGFITEVTNLTLAQREIQHLTEELANRLIQLSGANKELETFSYTLSHDLRTPLTVILTQCELISRELGSDAGAQRRLGKIRAGARRMNDLIGDILSLTRDTNKPLALARLDITGTAEAVLDELALRDPNRVVEIEIEEGLHALGDAAMVHIVLENILGNAWKYTSKKRRARIEVGAADTERGRAFFVRDDGAGFDMRQAAHMFEPFTRLHDRSEYEGSGVGLATVRKILRRHGGDVWARSEPGKGATFYFTLPEVAGAPKDAASDEPRVQPAPRARRPGRAFERTAERAEAA